MIKFLLKDDKIDANIKCIFNNNLFHTVLNQIFQ